jgi:hypothetical protein
MAQSFLRFTNELARPKRLASMQNHHDARKRAAIIFQCAVCLPQTSALPLKLRDIGTSRWQLCIDTTSSQGGAEEGSYYV